uniref:FH2 domain containing 3 n=1 Tax=Takifugu rubripes TaxID=31033 RepID=A0A3B5K6W2_TAKRU
MHFGDFLISSGGGQRRSMKKLNWDTIPSHNVLGKVNVWTSKRPQRDLVLDIQAMEELFSHVDKAATLRISRRGGVKALDGLELFPLEHQVTILDAKKSMNIGIFLRHFKRRASPQVKQLLAFSGKLCVLPEADQFMVQLVKVPGYEEHLKTMVLREEFFPFMEEVKSSVAAMIKGANELLDCDDLHSVIRLVLKAGNYMNSGGYTANAIGFRMTSLLKLADTKANKPGMNLMHYVAKVSQGHCAAAPNGAGTGQLPPLTICKEEVIVDFYNEVKKVERVKVPSSRPSAFLKDMEVFLMAKLAEVEALVQELNALSGAVAEYFCEDPASFRLDECCSIFHSFCKRFAAAVQENQEREAAEQRRRRTDSLRVASKRHSIASYLGSQPDLERASLESTLHSFLSSVPEGLTRGRRSRLAPVDGSPSECKTKPVERTEAVACSKARAEKKRQKQPEDERKAGTSSKDDPEDSPRRSYGARTSPATPRTPRPTSRDYYFGHGGELGSPWTILSPVTSVHREARKGSQCRLSSGSRGDDLDDGVWDSDEAVHLPGSCNRNAVSPPYEDPLLDGPRPWGKPAGRSASVDESSQSLTSRFSLGELFQRSSELEVGKPNSSGLISFFRRIGGKTNKRGLALTVGGLILWKCCHFRMP